MDRGDPTRLDYATPMPPPRRRGGWFLVLLLGAMLLAGLAFALMFRVQVMPRAVVAPAPPPPAVVAPPPQLTLPDGPADVTILQRTHAALPGSADTIHVSIGDITAGQVLLAVAGADGTPLVARTSVRPGDRLPFAVAGASYELTVVELRNFLTGDDHAVVRVGRVGAALTERQKIDALIREVEQLDGATFIRNGDEHTPAEAADHLRRKAAAAGDRVTTARQFVDDLATKSSLSGDPYRIRLKDGTEVSSKDHLTKRLDALEAKDVAHERARSGHK